MKFLIVLITLTTLALSSLSQLQAEEYAALGFVELDHPFGARHFYRENNEVAESVVKFPEGGMLNNPDVIRDLHRKIADVEKDRVGYKKKLEDCLEKCSKSEGPGFFKFLPVLVATLTPQSPYQEFSSECYKNESVSLQIDSNNNSSITLIHKRSEGKFICGSSYLYTTIKNFHVENYYFKGTTKITFALTSDDWKNIQTTGVMVFRFCESLFSEFPDLLKTLLLFIGGFGLDPNLPIIGGKPTPEQIKENIKFIYEATGYQWQKRPQDVIVELNQSLIRSGDFIAITRFDGIDQIIQWGTGSHAGHSAMALWVGDELYVVESQSAWYWPRRGIQINPYTQWIAWARNADFMVTWLPLTDEASKKFNATAAYEWFKKIEGTPYGYHNFLWGWIDTVNASCPALLDPEFIAPLFSVLEKISPDAEDKIFGSGMNMRLGTQNLSVAEIVYEAYRAGKTMPEMYAIVEEDGWVYSDGLSYVCSAFVTAMWKAGGLFDGLNINAVEFTPRDIYQSTFIDPRPKVPENCKAVDESNPFCQIMGLYRIEFPGISTVEPYSHMNERCPSLAPDYNRTAQC